MNRVACYVSCLFFVTGSVSTRALSAGAASHPTKAGTYVVGHWIYEYSITSPGTKSEGRHGKLFHAGKELTAPDGTVVATPVGKFMFFALPPPNVHRIWGADGWLQTLCYDKPVFNSDGSVVVEFASKARFVDADALLEKN
jgi:hypothetical protein